MQSVTSFGTFHCTAIGTGARDGVEVVRHADDSSEKVNLITFETVRITAAVQALMVAANAGEDRFAVDDRPENVLTRHGMSLNRDPLVGSQLAGLIEDRLRDSDLADVVQCRSRADLPHFSPAQPYRLRQGNGRAADALRVTGRIRIPRFKSANETVDPRQKQAADFARLPPHRGFKLLLINF